MTAIEFENISKQYRLGLVSTGTLSHDLNRFWQTKVLRREDPYLKVGEVNDRAHKGESEYVWALKDINFKVEQGDVVGIIGRNGAGKSTLLKLLSRVTAPTTGTIRARGRIASLLEVGTGFHPEMTGRENIYMNGAIMGMSRAEITRKLDEIVDFSGCERYLDTPVKRYSSGMTVRLGFAIAAHLEPEILVVDEVLAVGDAEFQKKAIGKMQDVSRGEGRTVLFVSHNMGAVKNLCKRGIVLNQGQVAFDGGVEEAINYYTDSNVKICERKVIINDRDHREGILPKDLEFIEAEMLNSDIEHLATDEPLQFRVKIKKNNPSIKIFTIGTHAVNMSGHCELTTASPIFEAPNKAFFNIELSIKNHTLAKGNYKIYFNIGIKDVSRGTTDYDVIKNVLFCQIFYKNKKSQEAYSGWQNGWGSHFVESVEYKLD
ncbi:polysaccharide ABC transporter ATP-binding protein [uncultured Fibrobacter sp.]|uniref:ABC transporter ATP-binding protein n=1 Tax=uncultured Fibrobacter sp. TaxID=261512 RepID=UPI0025FDD8D2|nr:polysaccharide ABC transporter ATP-binding protein [uncultured Fibrobacter sp.]